MFLVKTLLSWVGTGQLGTYIFWPFMYVGDLCVLLLAWRYAPLPTTVDHHLNTQTLSCRFPPQTRWASWIGCTFLDISLLLPSMPFFDHPFSLMGHQLAHNFFSSMMRHWWHVLNIYWMLPFNRSRLAIQWNTAWVGALPLHYPYSGTLLLGHNQLCHLEIYINPTTCQVLDCDTKLTSVAQETLLIYWLKPMTFECFKICILSVSHLTRACGTAECAHYWTTNVSDTSFLCKIRPWCIHGMIYSCCTCPSLVNTNNCNGFWPLPVRCIHQSGSYTFPIINKRVDLF